MENFGFFLYLIFIASWFLHITARIQFLGTIRFDLILAIFIAFLYFAGVTKKSYVDNECYRRLLGIFVAIAIATPFAEWPGSVLRTGLWKFVESIVFFFFTVWYVTTEEKLKAIISVFVASQSFRVMEPLYLHIVNGYWGSHAFMSNGEFMDRLSGAPYDFINPNGLAFVILTIFPFFIILFREHLFWKIASASMIPVSLFALYLTGSRSGLVGLLILLLVFFIVSKRKALVICILISCSLFALPKIQGDMKDRYLSIIDEHTNNSSTADGRIQGIYDDIKVGMRRPLFGHGLGTSYEANSNFGTDDKMSHNIFSETFQELGLLGLIALLFYIWAIVKTAFLNIRKERDGYPFHLNKIIFIFAIMNVIFGMASYGLSSYEWYFWGGLTIVVSEQIKSLDDQPIVDAEEGALDEMFDTRDAIS